MMAAKVATGYAAEIGAMRIGEEIDALDVMGVESITFLCATRVMAVWLVLPFLYASAIAVGFLGSYIAVVAQVAQTTGSAYLAIFWQFQSPPDMLFSLAKAMLARGDRANAERLVREAWRNDPMSEETENNALDQFGALLTPGDQKAALYR